MLYMIKGNNEKRLISSFWYSEEGHFSHGVKSNEQALSSVGSQRVEF